MKAIVTVIGKDRVGITAAVCSILAQHNINILDITQTILQDIFTMVMLVDISDLVDDFADLQNDLYALGDKIGMKIHVMHEDIFNSMHHI